VRYSTDPRSTVVSRDLSTLVAVDFSTDDPPDPCSWCPDWRFEWVDTESEGPVLREWHLPTCSVPTKWGTDVASVASSWDK
jgi:hypothetical protein